MEAKLLQQFLPKNKVRFVTATALFDGHDASINIMRRLLQARGAEVIHLGHNRSAAEVVMAALQEDVQGIAVSSYQGGHMEYFKYMRELLDRSGGTDVKIFGGGGGVITPKEISELEASGVTKIFSPEDGQNLSLAGIIGYMLHQADVTRTNWRQEDSSQWSLLGRALTLLEEGHSTLEQVILRAKDKASRHFIPVLGITGTGGAGKSSLTDELISRFLLDFPKFKVGVLCIDPSKKKTGGALLGDRIRMNCASDERVFLRSMATRDSGSEVAKCTKSGIELLRTQDLDLIVIETSGIGQGDSQILELANLSLYVMTPEFGAQTQLEKIDMLDFADLIAINKFERRQGPDALRDVRNQLRRTRFGGKSRFTGSLEEYPVFGTIASRFNDDGVNGLYRALLRKLNEHLKEEKYAISPLRTYAIESSQRESLIPAQRSTYLGDIAAAVRSYHSWIDREVQCTQGAEALDISATLFTKPDEAPDAEKLKKKAADIWQQIDPFCRKALQDWPQQKLAYDNDEYFYRVRGKEVRVAAKFESLAHIKLPKVALPEFTCKGEILRYLLKEGLPGNFPYTGGVFPFRRADEEPRRQFAGEGGPKRTNARFHFLSANDPAKRLSTAFDSVTLYGADPDRRPDIYGKVGESGVSIATLDDMKQLYAGFDLCSPMTSVSMTINGPAPIILAMFMNAAVDQQVDVFAKENARLPNAEEHAKIFKTTLQAVRGTVQADILKEDQAQNTCIFSTEFALKLMGDIQEFFIEREIKNYYSVSISGYHIAEAGANPISQLAFTLANGFTYVEYYLARGMAIDDFAPNLSFFFSNGLDPEYAVLGRVARRIWSIAMRDRYKAADRSQKLKYHIQTSGRSLHAQEIDFNDIRTTLQALVALYDNCNSLHTNAFDEAITTPTEHSVRRAMAIQMIINREFGPNKCENINQGSFFLEKLTDLVEEAVMVEFDRISSRGGVLGAMETQYQRSRIQEESLYYEHQKDSGELPIIGVNTFRSQATHGEGHDRADMELARSTYPEKDDQLKRLQDFQARENLVKADALDKLKQAVLKNENIFTQLMHTTRHASLGEISQCLYRVGGQYRRSM